MKRIVITTGSLLLIAFGALIQMNCGSAVAQGTISALEVLFDNSGTNLSATNLQDAVTELSHREECSNPTTDIIGSWRGSKFSGQSGELIEEEGIIWDFNADGTFTSNTSDFASGIYKVLSCNSMVMISPALGTGLRIVEGFHITPSTLSMAFDTDVAFSLNKN